MEQWPKSDYSEYAIWGTTLIVSSGMAIDSREAKDSNPPHTLKQSGRGKKKKVQENFLILELPVPFFIYKEATYK